jgi:phytoene synthase
MPPVLAGRAEQGSVSEQEAGAAASADHCATIVRTQQRERYLAALFAPPAARADLFALYAFDHEIGRVPTLVTTPIAGLIRLQWWRDAVAAIAAGQAGPAQPVAAALRGLAERGRLPQSWLAAAIDAREQEVEAEPPADLAAFERHLAVTAGGLVESALGLLGASAPALLAAGRDVGLACGLADTLTALPAAAVGGRLWLPQDLLAEAGIAPDQPLAPGDLRRLQPVVAALAAAARKALQVGRGVAQPVPQLALPALLPGTLVARRLRQLARHGHDPAALLCPVEPALAPLRLLAHRLLRRI